MKCIYGIKRKCKVLMNLEEALQLSKMKSGETKVSHNEIAGIFKMLEQSLTSFTTNPLMLFDVLAKYCATCPDRIMYIQKKIEKENEKKKQ